mmetsp:Transcript_14663/g.30718  ORF Transcript_14663/g.30718 Transcript_14663/m.30718 type:complete len:262 (-) Transcript_14663:45-830(-)
MMKSLCTAFGLFMAASTATAFAPAPSSSLQTSLRMAEEQPEMTPLSTEEDAAAPAPVETLPAMSQSIPFMARPAALDGTLAGDVGFDPLGFAKSELDLMNFREAEVKHARLAMLAAAGWPVSELLDKKIASAFGMSPILDNTDRVPSLLNGGLGKISPLYWVGTIGLAAAIDIIGTMRSKNASDEYLPGDFGLRFGYPSDEAGQKRMQLAEIKNGRLAMIAIFGFAIQEFVYKQGVVDETPFFFFPLVESMHKYANSGYIQ